MQMHRDISIWLVAMILKMRNIAERVISSVQEVSKTALTEHIKHQTVAVIWIVVHHLYAQTVAASVWVATS